MLIRLLNQGKAALAAQAAGLASDKLTFHSFKVSSELSASYNPDMTAPATPLLFTGNVANMTYAALGPQDFTLSIDVPPDQPYGVIGSVVLYVSYLGTTYAFAALFLDDERRYNYHLNSADNEVGTDHTINVMLRLPSWAQRFDLSNITQTTAEWLQVETLSDVDHPRNDYHEQIFIQHHWQTAEPVLAHKVGNELWGTHEAYLGLLSPMHYTGNGLAFPWSVASSPTMSFDQGSATGGTSEYPFYSFDDEDSSYLGGGPGSSFDTDLGA